MRNIFSPFAAKQKPKAVSLRTSDRCHWCGNPFSCNAQHCAAHRAAIRYSQQFDKLEFVLHLWKQTGCCELFAAPFGMFKIHRTPLYAAYGRSRPF